MDTGPSVDSRSSQAGVTGGTSPQSGTYQTSNRQFSGEKASPAVFSTRLLHPFSPGTVSRIGEFAFLLFSPGNRSGGEEGSVDVALVIS